MKRQRKSEGLIEVVQLTHRPLTPRKSLLQKTGSASSLIIFDYGNLSVDALFYSGCGFTTNCVYLHEAAGSRSVGIFCPTVN
eukprot:m.45455 g.45455  ORF g.45455 m.45455 type:complete len:82 (-) comp10244_c0_seq3:769-1014(-)